MVKRTLALLLLVPSMAFADDPSWTGDGADGWGTGDDWDGANAQIMSDFVSGNDDRLDAILSTDTCTTPPCDLTSGTTVGGASIQTGTDDDVPDAGDFGAAANLDANGALTGSIDLGTGTIRGGVSIETTSSTTHTLSAAEGQWLFADESGATQIDLPAAASGSSVCIYSATAQVISVNPNGSENIFLDGATVGAGDEIDSPGELGDFVCLLSNGTNWYVMGLDGAWIDGGAS